MEVGLGIHGEPGMKLEAVKSADAVVDDVLTSILSGQAQNLSDYLSAPQKWRA